MMGNVVEEGTGTAAALSGIQRRRQDRYRRGGQRHRQPGVVHRLRPAGQPQMAVAVTIERTQGQGGTEAAPIAKQVLEALLGG